MKSIFLVLFLTSSIATFGQHMFDETTSNCDYSEMSTENRSITTIYKSPELFYEDLLKDVNPKHIEKLNGELLLQILIDKNLTSCCISIKNSTNVSSGKLKLVKNINRMDKWKNKTDKSRKVSTVIKVIITPEQVKKQRLRVSAYRRLELIESNTI
jgi:hypothetical protein